MAKESVSFKLENVSGAHDKKEIKRVLDTLPGVRSVSVNDASGQVAVDFDTGIIRNITAGKTYQAEPFPEFIQNIIKKGGLLASLKEM